MDFAALRFYPSCWQPPWIGIWSSTYLVDPLLRERPITPIISLGKRAPTFYFCILHGFYWYFLWWKNTLVFNFNLATGFINPRCTSHWSSHNFSVTRFFFSIIISGPIPTTIVACIFSFNKPFLISRDEYFFCKVSSWNIFFSHFGILFHFRKMFTNHFLGNP